MPDNRCEGGCSRHWTYEWLHESGQRWQLCDVHSARSAETLDRMGFLAFAKAEDLEEAR